MKFSEDIETAKVSDLPIRDAVSVEPGTLVRAAVADMRTNAMGCAVIIDASRRPTGIFTERSVIDLLLENEPLDERPVQQFADESYCVVNLDDPVRHVWDLIREGHARFVCVTDGAGKLVGVTGQRGVAEYVADCFAEQVTVQRLGSTPWMQEREGA